MHGEVYANRSEPKVLVGKKRDSMDIEETIDSSSKRVKMRDIESVFRSEGKGSSSTAIDLNVNLGSANDPVGDGASMISIKKMNKHPTTGKEEMKEKDILSKHRGFDLDLNIDDISSSANDPFYPYKNYELLKSRDESECGSSVGPLDEKDSMRVWKGLKQNNYMSSSLHGSVPIPKPRGRKKSNNDVMKKNVELGKKEQVDRFANIAAPSGLLNGLNPSIINHVRNSRQVHSIIKAMVKERDENNIRQAVQKNNVARGFNEWKNATGIPNGPDRSDEWRQFPCPKTELLKGVRDSFVGHNKDFTKMSSLCSRDANADDGLSLKLSSLVPVTSENYSCLSNDESGNLTSVNSLAFKAANVASQWLELLTQDIKGRLSALRRSKKRVRAVITTELPSLLSREFSLSNQGKDSKTQKDSNTLSNEQGSAEAHSAKWSLLFEQMEKTLSEEENHLETWLNQVKEMQGYCDKGLNKTSLCPPIQQPAACLGKKRSSGEVEEYSEDLAVNAAAASIYSTCNFLMSMESQRCG